MENRMNILCVMTPTQKMSSQLAFKAHAAKTRRNMTTNKPHTKIYFITMCLPGLGRLSTVVSRNTRYPCLKTRLDDLCKRCNLIF